jgi:hypothetical protein
MPTANADFANITDKTPSPLFFLAKSANMWTSLVVEANALVHDCGQTED